MKELTFQEYILGNIHCVIKSFMSEGFYDNTRRGRHSECLVLVTSGNAEYCFDGRILAVEKGDVIFLPKNSRYTIKVFADYKFIYTDFDICSEDSGTLCAAVYRPYRQKAQEAFRRLLFYWTKGGRKKLTKSRQTLYSIYDLIIDTVLFESEKQMMLIEPALHLIALEKNDEKVTVELLADACGISSVHLRRLFMKQFGMSPIKYISKQKTERAKELLRYDSLSITDISETLGFSSIYYFCKSFKKETGLTPGEYRRLYSK